MIEVWIQENDLNYYYANGFPSKYWSQPPAKTGYLKMSITLNEMQVWQNKTPKSNLQEKRYGGKQLLND